LVGILMLVLGVGAAFLFLPITEYLNTFLKKTEQAGPWGPVMLVGVYIVVCVAGLPGSILTLGAGALFGVVVGTLTVSIGSTLGASAAFLVGRTLARGLIESKVSGNLKFRAIDRAVGEQGFKIVLLTRLSPVFPFNLLNYAFGLTRVSFGNYFLASWIGMIPGTVMYVYLGSAAGQLGALATGTSQRSPAEYALLFVGLAATVVVTVLVTRVASKALKQAVPETEPSLDAATPNAAAD
jgi:uncharacterized membrane protein YdjX (TVP38/TMEM64 family)